LSAEEAAAWARLAATVKPINPLRARLGEGDHPQDGGGAPSEAASQAPKSKPPVPLHPRPAAGGPLPRAKLGEDRAGLDSTWDRRLSRGTLSPDFTLDLHGHTLASAHARLDHGLIQAKALGARVVLLITGTPRPTEAADRGEKRGAIRAKVLDWLAVGPHSSSIAAIRKAHRRHGGDGALYLVLKRNGCQSRELRRGGGSG
jgi:DNA-nicking Smr family endonuclease